MTPEEMRNFLEGLGFSTYGIDDTFGGGVSVDYEIGDDVAYKCGEPDPLYGQAWHLPSNHEQGHW
jgi:hypothetical protein